MWSEFSCPPNQHPGNWESSPQKSPQTLAHFGNLSKNLPRNIITKSCYFDYRINKHFTCSRCVISVSCSVHLISVYYVRKGSWALLLPTKQRIHRSRNVSRVSRSRKDGETRNDAPFLCHLITNQPTNQPTNLAAEPVRSYFQIYKYIQLLAPLIYISI